MHALPNYSILWMIILWMVAPMKGFATIIGTAESLATPMSWLYNYLYICLAKGLCHVTSQTLILGWLSYWVLLVACIYEKNAAYHIDVLQMTLMWLSNGMSKIDNYITYPITIMYTRVSNIERDGQCKEVVVMWLFIFILWLLDMV